MTWSVFRCERWEEMADHREAVQRQFGPSAIDYRDEALFAEGVDLNLMVNAIQLNGDESVLDVGSGAGHTALAFAPFVRDCLGVDVTAEMVQIATAAAKQQALSNVHFLQGDAENLPFPDGMFDVVACRFAAHHFWDVERSMAEVARVLKAGGVFLLVDHYAPEEWDLDHFVNELDRIRDPSHVREYTLTQWQSYFTSNQLSFEQRALWDLRIDFASWVKRAKTPAERREELVALLGSATSEGKMTFCIELGNHGEPLSFCLKCAFIMGRKMN